MVLFLGSMAVASAGSIDRVTNLKVKNIKARSVLLKWNQVDNVEYYKVRLTKRNKKLIKSWKHVTNNKKLVKKRKKIIKPGKKYKFKVKACIDSECGTWSKWKKFKTKSPVSAQCRDNIYNCSDFNTQANAQAIYNQCVSEGQGDVHDLDRDGNGMVCESLP